MGLFYRVIIFRTFTANVSMIKLFLRAQTYSEIKLLNFVM